MEYTRSMEEVLRECGFSSRGSITGKKALFAYHRPDLVTRFEVVVTIIGVDIFQREQKEGLLLLVREVSKLPGVSGIISLKQLQYSQATGWGVYIREGGDLRFIAGKLHLLQSYR